MRNGEEEREVGERWEGFGVVLECISIVYNELSSRLVQL
jgi:hypothetical protein